MDSQVMSDWEVEVQSRRSITLEILLQAATIAGFLAVFVFYFTLPGDLKLLERVVQVIPFLAACLLVLVTWRWQGLGYHRRTWIALGLIYAVGIWIFWRGDLPGSGRVWLLLPPSLAVVLLGPRPGVWAAVASVLIYVFFGIAFGLGLQPLAPLETFGEAGAWFGEGASFVMVSSVLVLILLSFNQGWLDALTNVSRANRKLQARSEDLEEIARQLQATAAVSQACASILEPEALMPEVVKRIQNELNRMGVYYVGLFLLEESEDDTTYEIGEMDETSSAVLKAAAGSAGQQLLRQEYTRVLDRTSAVGRCVILQRPVIAPDVEEGTVLVDEPLLDPTRSEAAVPLRSRGRVLGALSVHSTQEEAFDPDDLSVIQTMADQVSVALDNARLLVQTGAALREVQAAQRRYLGQAWGEFLSMGASTGVDYVRPDAEPGSDELLQEARRVAVVYERAVATDNAASDEGTESPQTVLAVPLKVRGEVIGTLALHATDQRRAWTSEEIGLAEAIAEQVALTAENLRLMDQTQQYAARERGLREIDDRMRRATDVKDLMQIAAEELNRVLGGSRVYVRLGAEGAE